MKNFDVKELLALANEARGDSYSPYSEISVGAALLTKSGKIYKGCNIENASYTPTICAERTALFCAGSSHPGMAVTALAIAAHTGDDFTLMPIAPCGACRQVMLETEQRGGHPIRVLLYGTSGIYIIPDGAHALLPISFKLTGE